MNTCDPIQTLLVQTLSQIIGEHTEHESDALPQIMRAEADLRRLEALTKRGGWEGAQAKAQARRQAWACTQLWEAFWKIERRKRLAEDHLSRILRASA